MSNRDSNRGYDRDRRSPDRSRTRDKQDYNRHNNRNNNYNDRWDNDRHRDRYNNNNRNANNNRDKQVPKVFDLTINPPELIVLAEKAELKGTLIVNLKVEDREPQRAEESRLGELKNKITPIQKLWTSHIKQYLNDSEFVEIHRKWKSLAYGDVQYGRSLIRYDEQQNDICYDNSKYQSPIFSRAYFKLWEILQLGILRKYEGKKLTIGCIAQGPGGFIHSLIDYREKQHKDSDASPKDTFHSITLKIDNSTRHAKDWSDPRGQQLFNRLRRFGWKINLSYGRTETGNLLLTDNIEGFAKEVGEQKCLVVTGDGGIECIGDKEFEYQQVFNAKLFLAQMVTALHIQAVGGLFILKIYDCGFELTRQIILLLALYYKVSIVKPVTSRPGNSEKYLLCQEFAGISEAQLSTLKKALEEWTAAQPKLSYFQNEKFAHSIFDFSKFENYQKVHDNIRRANDVFVKEQQQKLEEGLQLAATHQDTESIETELRKHRFTEQVSFAYAWCKKYRLATIDVEIVPKPQGPTIKED